MHLLGWRLQDRATGAFLVPPGGDEVELEVGHRGLARAVEAGRAAQAQGSPGKLGAEDYELEALMAAERKATADGRLRWHHAKYRIAHRTFNHRLSAVNAAIAAGALKDAARPPDFSRPACA